LSNQLPLSIKQSHNKVKGAIRKCVGLTIVAGLAHTMGFGQDMKGLKDYYKDYFLIGVAVTPRLVERGPEEQLIRQEFNSLTAENVMKMGPIHPQKNAFNWAPADQIVQYAMDHHLKMRGHNLCWHRQAPPWFFQNDAGGVVSRDTLLARLRDHIFAVAGRYRGKVYAWDVVNEAIADGDSIFFRDSEFYKICGEEFISKAFIYAHEADPDAILFYNDYNTERPAKREKIYKLLKKMKEAGVPVHGIGLQGHWSLTNPQRAELEKTIEMFAGLGLQVQITELDVSVYGSRKDAPLPALTPALAQKQADQYRMVFEVFRKYKKAITGVTFWNLSDKHSWLDSEPVKDRKNYPLLFDQNLLRKKAYLEVVDF
jgi:endo-1,4-beta-xylanase